MSRKKWRCFHCDEVFTSRYHAQVHFGHDEGCEPACRIAGATGSIIGRLREAERDAADAWAAIHNEATDAAKAYHAQASRHQGQLIAAEELGYERGLRDAREEAEKLRKGIEWYANAEIFKPSEHGIAFDRRDLSFVARDILAEIDSHSPTPSERETNA